jgi:hypothetical protein
MITIRTASYLTAATVLLLVATAQTFASSTHYEDRSQYHAPQAGQTPAVDGMSNEAIWARAEWQPLEHLWLGPAYSPTDFQGRYKVAWTKTRLYILFELTDDILFDSHHDPLQQYWDDDCLEIFIDEDHSGGDHQYNHNAFAYHLSLDNRAIDIGTDEQPRDYSHHVESRWRQHADRIVWEVSIDVYDDSYVDESSDNQPVSLSAGKVLGLMVAYCDNDGSELRENFIGSESVPFGPKDRGWIDAGLFGTLVLDE